MTFKFTTQPLMAGLYEPEGIYLQTPFAGPSTVVQFWGDYAAYYSQFTYNGVPLKGHPGLDFALQPGTRILAVDAGRVIELGEEPGGFGRYLKMEHTWGESLVALLDEIEVEAGQLLKRSAFLGYSSDGADANLPHLHLGIRIKPYNRFDGWGGFADPLPFLNATDLRWPSEAEAEQPLPFAPSPMLVEQPGSRRP